jgi:hypothetical protein
MDFLLLSLAFFGVFLRRTTIIAHSETTYKTRILALKKKIASLEEQMQSEQDLIASLKTPGSLLRAFLSPSLVRSSDLYQITQARSKISQLQLQLFQAEIEMQDVERLRTQFPDHDRLIEQASHVGFASWRVSIQEEELDVYERECLVQERLEAKRLQEEEQRILEELLAIERQQEELARKKAELSKRTK